jgi:ribonuclease HI
LNLYVNTFIQKGSYGIAIYLSDKSKFIFKEFGKSCNRKKIELYSVGIALKFASEMNCKQINIITNSYIALYRYKNFNVDNILLRFSDKSLTDINNMELSNKKAKELCCLAEKINKYKISC